MNPARITHRTIITGESSTTMPEAETAPSAHDQYTAEPTVAEAANLYQKLIALGPVARLDVLHDALVTAHRRGRAAEHVELERIADETRRAFGEAVRDRGLEVEAAAGRPWWQQ